VRSPRPDEVILRSGQAFTVAGAPGNVTLRASLRDKYISDCGLGRYMTFHEPGDPTAEHRGMPVEIVRVYTKIHGGVASAGVEALALLKTLPSAEAPLPDAPPAPEAVQGGGEAARGRPFFPRWPSLPPPRPLTGRAGWWTTSPRP
jgi:hypothetical protein